MGWKLLNQYNINILGEDNSTKASQSPRRRPYTPLSPCPDNSSHTGDGEDDTLQEDEEEPGLIGDPENISNASSDSSHRRRSRHSGSSKDVPKAYQQNSENETSSLKRRPRAGRRVQARRRLLERRQLENRDEELSVGARLARNRRERLKRLRLILFFFWKKIILHLS